MLIRIGTGIIVGLVGILGLVAPMVGSGLALFTGQQSNANNTFTSVNCFPGNTGLLNPSANAADTGGSGNGFESSPQNAYSDGSGNASNIDGPGDRHRYYNYNTSIKSSCAIKGIEVRLEWWLDSTSDTNSISVELSWDGGATWTAAQTDSTETMSEHTAILGGSLDTWGRAWTAADLSDANSRVRLTSNCTGAGCAGRDFYLDWVPVTVYYGPPTPTPPPPPPTPTPTDTPTPTPTDTPTPTPTPTDTPTPTPTPTDTPTPTPTDTFTPTPTDTFTPTPTPTDTPTPTPTFTPTPTPMRLVVSSYVGNGIDNRNITGVGFQPDVVIIKASTVRAGIIRTSTMGGDAAKVLGTSTALQSNYIQSLNADGFTVGTAQQVNTSGTTYYYAAMKAGSDLKVGSYVGNGVDNRSITGVGFQPVWVITLGDGDDSVFRPNILAGDNSYLMTGTGKLADRIQAFQTDGFQVGANVNVNESGTTFHYIAWAASPQVSTGSYTGNGVDNRSITGIGFGPLMAWVKRDDAQVGVWRPASVGPGDSTLYWAATAAAANLIQALQADGFQVGTNSSVNTNGSLYYRLALRNSGP